MVAPPSISATVVADYDSETLLLNDGDLVNSWAPSVGTDILNLTDSTFPLFREDADGLGHAGVEFSNDTIYNDDSRGDLPWSILIVFNATDVNHSVISNSHNNSFAGSISVEDGSVKLIAYQVEITDGVTTPNDFHVALGVFDTTNASVQLDGGAKTVSAVGTTRHRSGLKLGNEPGSVNRFPFVGSILRLITFDGRLSDQDAIDLDTWVQDTYGIPVADYAGSGSPVTSFADALYFGNTPVDKAYIGADLIWDSNN